MGVGRRGVVYYGAMTQVEQALHGSYTPGTRRRRGRYRPPEGLPERDYGRGRWTGWIVSIALHALVLFLLLIPAVGAVAVAVRPRVWGLSGAFKGGGGGGASAEHLTWVAPPPVTPVPPRVRHIQAKPVTPPRVVPPPALLPPAPVPQPVAPPTLSSAVAAGAADGTGGAGAGPGTGGGVGGGKGPGAGNGTGPGTAGEPSAIKVPAEPIDVMTIGVDPPSGVRPFHLVALFAVTATGGAHLLSFTPTHDGGFNRRLREELEEQAKLPWKPAMLRGIAVADTASFEVDF